MESDEDIRGPNEPDPVVSKRIRKYFRRNGDSDLENSVQSVIPEEVPSEVLRDASAYFSSQYFKINSIFEMSKAEVIRILRELRDEIGFPINGYSNMSVSEMRRYLYGIKTHVVDFR